jgi:hypothetical protein
LAEAYSNRGVLKYVELKDRSGGIDDMKRSAKIFQQQGNAQIYQRAIDLVKKWQQVGGN